MRKTVPLAQRLIDGSLDHVILTRSGRKWIYARKPNESLIQAFVPLLSTEERLQHEMLVTSRRGSADAAATLSRKLLRLHRRKFEAL